MIEHIEHIAIKVAGLEPVTQALEALGIPCKNVEKFDEVGMKIAFLGSGQSQIELLEVTDRNSPISDHPHGLHHIALKVSNIEEIYKQMQADERYELQGDIRQGAHSRIFFFKLKDQREILFECVE